ncbi:metallophosphoesterase [Natronoflexus pectinivorans]|uniref:Calcineurin-like phosphoesterase family protein n=1 Tax=Natronoflexus pectinivorans TaxID=682526 RepID=A0A4R2GCA7_9BACT|nr:metallophosphoesterase [Natronoflexus pectinivorans]TCO05372.1 calcineurin-like phosphoesterase family protein [Natronoflexus pectinivorans]
MTVQYCSDLHLEFAQNALFLHKNPIKPVGEILILAGDITYWGQKHFKHWFFDYVSDHWKAVYYVPGNHEFYSGKDLRVLDHPVYENIRENVFIVNNKVVSVNECDLFFTVLWSHIPPDKSLIVEYGVSDFHLIKYRGRKLKSSDFNHLHQESVEFLRDGLSKSNAKHKIVVSHHVPSQIVNPQIYKNSEINSAFVSEQSDLMFELQPDYWIYGHHHANIPDTLLDNTKLVTNQLCYVHLAEHFNYRNAAVILD